MVLVTDQIRCERLITAGRALADRRRTSLMVINTGRPGTDYNPQAIEHLFRVSIRHGAVMSIYYSDDPLKQLATVIREESPRIVVTGLPAGGASPLRELWLRFPSMDFYTVDLDGGVKAVTINDRVKESIQEEDKA